MLDDYRATELEAQAKGNKHVKWNAIAYEERAYAKTATQRLSKGKLMWEKEAIEYWMSTKGGALSDVEAEAKWKDMAKHHETRKKKQLTRTGPKQTLTMRVEKGTYINNLSEQGRQKEASFRQDKRKASEADLDIIMRDVTTNHETIGGRLVKDTQSVVESLARASATGDCFADNMYAAQIEESQSASEVCDAEGDDATTTKGEQVDDDAASATTQKDNTKKNTMVGQGPRYRSCKTTGEHYSLLV